MYNIEYYAPNKVAGYSETGAEELAKILGCDTVLEKTDLTKVDVAKLPIIFIMNGYGASGKDTFLDYCDTILPQSIIRISTVGPVYKAVNDVLLKDDLSSDGTAYRDSISKSVNTKDDAWRQFMHEVKMAWTKYCDGPIQYVLNRVEYVRKNLPEIKFIFVYSRESNEVVRFSKIFQSMGYLSARIWVQGPDENHWQNDCDREVVHDIVRYHYTIDNTGTLDDLKAVARDFMEKMITFYESPQYDYMAYRTHPIAEES